MSIYSKIKAKESFIHRAKLKHSQKYDYSLVEYINAKTKVKIICPIHGVFMQPPDSHLRCGCPKCKNEKTSVRCKFSKQEAIDKFIQAHGNKYDYSLVEYINQSIKVKIICPIHGVFEQTPHKHWNKRQCPHCARESVRTKQIGLKKGPSNKRITVETFINKANKLFDNKYDYSKANIYSSQSEIEIICKVHGSFFKRVEKHLLGRGCPECDKSRQYSKQSDNWLNSLGFPVLREYRIPEKKTRVVDGYDPTTNTVYQYHGDYWHGNPKRFNPDDVNKTTKKTFRELYENTHKHDEELKNFGYNLVIMWEYDWKNSR